MLLNSVVIVLREALEAALMISILLALSRILDIRVRWVAVAIVLGVLSAALYGASLSAISDLFDGVGQEIANATLQFLVFPLLVYCLPSNQILATVISGYCHPGGIASRRSVAISSGEASSRARTPITRYRQRSSFARSRSAPRSPKSSSRPWAGLTIPPPGVPVPDGRQEPSPPRSRTSRRLARKEGPRAGGGEGSGSPGGPAAQKAIPSPPVTAPWGPPPCRRLPGR